MLKAAGRNKPALVAKLLKAFGWARVWGDATARIYLIVCSRGLWGTNDGPPDPPSSEVQSFITALSLQLPLSVRHTSLERPTLFHLK